ncbi:MAG: hypothetical protein WB723_12375 [Candidatus Acidiferrales bacterium]
MNKIEKGIAAFILLGSPLTLAFEPPWIDLRQFGARPVQINTIGSGSGHSLTVGTNLFQQGANGIPGDGITVAGAGQEPQMHTPGAPTVTNSVSVDQNTRRLQITGGGNSAINPLSSPISSLRSR